MAEITAFDGSSTKADSASLIDDAVAKLMARVGERVRHAREQRNIPRRVLSEMSGVSPRYLAQLESGEGNISIGLLMRVAMALDFKIDWLVGEEDPWSSQALQMMEQFRMADKAQQREVIELLSSAPGQRQRAGRICLIGLRGAGKSTLGRMVGAALDLPFVELNREIELTGGMPVEEIMALYGQEGYRKLESDAMDRVISKHDRMILAVAGGIVSEPGTFNRLLGHFHTIWVKASAEEHMGRVRAQGDDRPMKGNPEAMAQLRNILKAREVLYERAHAELDTTGRSKEQSLGDLTQLIADQKFLS